MRYDIAAEQEYARFQENFGTDNLQSISTNLQSMLEQQMAATAEMLNNLSVVHTNNSSVLLEAISKPRNRTVTRDAEGKISGVRDE